MGAADHGPLLPVGPRRLRLPHVLVCCHLCHSPPLATVLRHLCLLFAGASFIVLPPVVYQCLHLRLFLHLRLLSHLCLLSCPSHLVGCCVSRCLSLSFTLRFRPAPPQPPPFIIITPRPFATPLFFSWFLRCLVPHPLLSS